jgi:8-amino-7-oxononanoate synthase
MPQQQVNTVNGRPYPVAMRKPESELEQLQNQHLLRVLDRERTFNKGELTSPSDCSLNFSSNDYLGLAKSPELKSAATAAIEQFGVGSTASRLLYGGSSAHRDLESKAAEFFGTEAALYFSSGYTAAVGTLGAIIKKGDTVILDKRCHACLIDGARLSGATIRVFPHNNLEKLERLLVTTGKDSTDDSRVLLITESVFSMDGDTSPLSEIIDLKTRFGALLLVDEAHALGVLGPCGRGLSQQTGKPESVDFLMATFGKAAGSAGGMVAASSKWIDLIVNKARSFIYSTAPPHAQAASALAGLRIIESATGDHRREILAGNVALLCNQLEINIPAAAIVPLILGEETSALEASAALQDSGITVPAIRYPTVARGSARLRISLSAAHSEENIHMLASTLGHLISTGKFTLAGNP